LLTTLDAIEFMDVPGLGKTEPAFLTCEAADGSAVEVVAKYSSGCEQQGVNLACEVLAACLAGDLELPIPEPFYVTFSEEFIAAVPHQKLRGRLQASSRVGFGSKLMTRQFSQWNPGNVISQVLLPTAAAVFAFDAIVQNPDRKPGSNPNCLVRGDEIRIIDHELAFANRVPIIGWKEPWKEGGLNHLSTSEAHIFRDKLRHRVIDWDKIRSQWSQLTDTRIESYANGLPADWGADHVVKVAVKLIKDSRDQINGCLAEISRVLQ
jgi:hypothetical protein